MTDSDRISTPDNEESWDSMQIKSYGGGVVDEEMDIIDEQLKRSFQTDFTMWSKDDGVLNIRNLGWNDRNLFETVGEKMHRQENAEWVHGRGDSNRWGGKIEELVLWGE